MGYVPTHGPNCFRVRSFYILCKDCGRGVVYFECSCGSKVLLDPPDEGNHNCIQEKRRERALSLLDLIESADADRHDHTECPMCGATIKNKDVKRHFRRCPNRKRWFPIAPGY
jgi:hypothetical protein